MNPYEREVAHLRHVISTAKIVVTLTVGIAATFVAAELQVNLTKPLGKRRPALLMVLRALCPLFGSLCSVLLRMKNT